MKENQIRCISTEFQTREDGEELIIEGYFANGSYTYKPSNTLTRGQLSAIVWRMRNYD